MAAPRRTTAAPAAPLRPERAPLRVAAAAAVLLGLVTYGNSLGNGLVLDDVKAIVENDAVRHPLDWRRLLLTPSWMSPDKPTTSYRPLTTATFAVNYAIHGERPFGYHLVNVVAHAGVAALVVALAAALGMSTTAAGLAGALFAVHPIHTEAVANSVGRADVLAAGLALAALLARRRAQVGTRPFVASAGAVLAYGLALLAKESALALLVLLPLSDLLFIDRGRPRHFLSRVAGARGLFYLALAAVTAGYLALRATALGDVVGAGGAGPGQIPFWLNPVASAPAAVRVLTALEVQALALWLLLAPFHLSAAYYYRHVAVVSSPWDPGAVAGLAVAAGLVALAVVLWRRPTSFFWLALAVLTYGVVSNLVIPIGTIFGERFLYLPSVGFCALLATLLDRPEPKWSRTAASVLAAALIAVWGVRTGFRNAVWHDDLRLGESMVADAPDSAHAHVFLGTTYALAGRDTEAITEFERAFAIYPAHVDALFNAGVIYMRHQQPREALALFGRVLDVEPRHFGSLVNIAAIQIREGNFTAALEAADRAAAIRPDLPNPHVMRGFALRGLGRLAEARGAFERALRLPNPQADALLGFATTALEQGDVARAATAFEILVGSAPSIEAYRGLVQSYRGAGREADAARAAAAAHARFPDDPGFTP